MTVDTRGISEMKLEEVDQMLQALGWKPDARVKLKLRGKKRVLRELLEKPSEVSKADPGKQQSSHPSLEETDMMLQELAEYVLRRRQPQTPEVPAWTRASTTDAYTYASSPDTLSGPHDTKKDPSPESERLQRKLKWLKGQLLDRKRKTVARDTDTPDTRSSRTQRRTRSRTSRRTRSRTSRRMRSRTWRRTRSRTWHRTRTGSRRRRLRIIAAAVTG